MPSRLRRFFRFTAASLFGPALIFGCESVAILTVQVGSIVVNPGQLTLTVGETAQLSAQLRSPSGAILSGRSVIWSSQDEQRATVDQNGMVRGEGPGPVEIWASAEGVTGTASIVVSSEGILVLSRSQVDFTVPLGSGPTNPVEVQVTNQVDGVLSGLERSVSYDPASASGWLEAQLDSNSTPATLTLRALPQGVAAGTHRASLAVSATGAGNSPTIQVTLVVQAGPPTILVNPTTVEFDSEIGQPPPAPETVAVTNASGEALTGLQASVEYAAGQQPGWLTVQLASTTTPTQLFLSVDPSTLVPGAYDADVRVDAPSTPSSATIRVRLRFGSPPPEIELDPREIQVTILEASPPLPSASVAVTNRGSGTLGNLAVSVSHPAGQPDGWLQASLSGTVAPATLALTVTPVGLLPGAYAANAVVSSVDAGNSPQDVQVALNVLPRPSPGLSLISGSPGSIVANGTSTSTITLSLRDLRGDPIDTGGHTVVMETSAGTLGAVTDNGDGTYSAILTSSTTTGTATIVANVDGDVLSNSAQVQFTPGPPTAIGLTGPAVVAASVPSDPFTLRLLDAFGNETSVLESTVYALSSSSGGTFAFDPASPITIPSGQSSVSFTYADSESGAKIVTAAWQAGFIDLGSDTHQIVVNAGTPASLRIVTQPDGGASGEALAVQPEIEILDATMNRVTADNVTEVSVAIQSGADGVLDGTLTVTADEGIARFTDLALSGTLGEEYVLRFTSVPELGFVDSEAVSLTGAGAPSGLRIASPPSGSVQSGVAFPAQPIVRLVDGSGNDVGESGVEVTVGISTGDPTLSSGAGLTAVTNASGAASFTGLMISGTPGPRTLVFTSPGLSSITSGTIMVGPGPASAANSIITANPISIEANESSTSTITVQLKDANGNDLTSGGASVTLATDAGTLPGACTTGCAATDNGDGTYSATLTSSATPGSATITGTVGGNLIEDTAMVEFTVGAPSPATSTITAAPGSITADGASTSTITVQLKDGNGNDLTSGGATVTLTTEGGEFPGPCTAGCAATDNGDGTYSAVLTSSTTAGVVTVTGTVNTEAIEDNAQVEFTPGPASAANSIITADPTSIEANESSTSTITVQLKDANDNDLTSGGASVRVRTSAGSIPVPCNPFCPTADNGDGTYSATLTSSATPGSATITGTVGGNLIEDTAMVEFTVGAPSPATSTITAAPGSIAADESSTSTITVQLKDAAGNDLTSGGASVTLTTEGGTFPGPCTAGCAATDNGDGTYSAVLTSSTTAGMVTVTGTVNTEAIEDNAQVEFTPGPASAANSIITADPTSIEANESSTSTITVQLRDANDNNLTLGGATVTLTTEGGEFPGPCTAGCAATDNGDGTYSAVLTSSTTAGTVTVTGTVNTEMIADSATVDFI